MKKVLSLLLTVALCFGLTIPAFAEGANLTIDGEEYRSTSNSDMSLKCSGDGWELDYVDVGNATLTLNGIHAGTIDVLGPVKIVLAPGSKNYLKRIMTSYGSVRFEGSGELILDSFSGSSGNSSDLFYKVRLKSLWGDNLKKESPFFVDGVTLKDNLEMTGGESEKDQRKLIKSGSEIKTEDGEIATYIRIAPAGSSSDTASISNVSKFSDVPANSPYAEAINWAVENGITTGKTATTFVPNEKCTRGQIVTFLWRASGSPEPKDENPFIDKIPTSFQTAAVWGYENLLRYKKNDYDEAASRGVNFVFGANDVCSRVEAVYDLYELADGQYYLDHYPSAEMPFTDTDDFLPGLSDRFKNAITWAVDTGITTGKTSTTFAPNDPCTRGQIMTFLYRCINQ